MARSFILLLCAIAAMAQSVPTSIRISRPGNILQGQSAAIAVNVYPYVGAGTVTVKLDGTQIAAYDMKKGGSGFSFHYTPAVSGNHSLVASYSGASGYQPCSTTQKVSIAPSPNSTPQPPNSAPQPSAPASWGSVTYIGIDRSDPFLDKAHFKLLLQDQSIQWVVVRVFRSDGSTQDLMAQARPDVYVPVYQASGNPVAKYRIVPVKESEGLNAQ